MNLSLNRDKKLQLIRFLISNSKVLYGNQEDGIIELLDYVFDLRNKPSEDSRFKDAHGDAIQHLINNDDWELEYTFLTRFDILEGDRLSRLIEFIVQPNFQHSEQIRIELVDELNTLLNPQGYTLETTEFNDSDQPIFSFTNYDSSKKYPAGVVKNDIRFFPNYELKNIAKFHPSQNDIFILDFRDFSWWNDYSLHSRCNLIYRDSNGELENFGELKIITNNPDNYSDGYHSEDYADFHTILPDSFTELDESYCSLGQSKDFYRALKEEFKAKFKSILYALRDAAFFSDIADSFEKEYYYRNSLIRNNKEERVLREAKLELNGSTRMDMYKFTYLFSPKLSDNAIPPIPIEFDFEDVSEIPNRICAIIGKNGVGKTQFISQLPKNLVEENTDLFESHIPLFSKIISLSYSPFDSFKPSKSGVNVDHIFCSLRDDSGNLGDDRSRAIKFGKVRKRVEELERVEDWAEILKEFLPTAFFDDVFDMSSDNKMLINVENLNMARRNLSSGQRILLETVTNIVAHIRYDSLLLFDEPETHLHPNAIAQLMNTIYELVNRFESFCIVTTHSPIIIRELLSRNVFVFDRVEDTLAIRKIGMESFGANLSDITEEVFGTNEIPKHHQAIIRKLKSEDKTPDDIIETIQSGNLPVSLNLRLFVQSLYQEEQ